MGCSRGVPGFFRAVLGCSGGVPGVFRGCSGGVPGVFRGVPGCSGVFRVCSGFYRHPKLAQRLFLFNYVSILLHSFCYYEKKDFPDL